MKLYWKIILATLGLVIIGIIVVGMYLFQFGGIERLVTRQVNELLRGTTHLRVTVGEIGGDALSGLIVRNLEVRYQDSITNTQLLSAASARVTYSLRGLLDAHYAFGDLALDSLYLRLVEKEDGSLLGFDLEMTKDTTVRRFDQGKPLELEISRLKIRHSTVELHRATDTLVLRDLFLASSFKLETGTLSLEVDSLQAVIDSPQVTIRHLSGKITAGATTIAAQEVQLTYDSTSVQLDGGGTVRPMSLSARLKAESFDLAILEPLFRVYLTGKVDLDGKVQISDSVVTGDARVRGIFMDVPFRDVMSGFTIVDEVLTLDRIRGAIFDSTQVNGSGWISFANNPEEYSFNGSVERFNLAPFAGRELTSSLTGTLGLSGQAFDLPRLRLDIAAELSPSNLAGHAIDTLSGQFSVYADSLILDGPVALGIGLTNGVATGELAYAGEIRLNVEVVSHDIAPILTRYDLLPLRGKARGSIRLDGQTLAPDGVFSLRSDSLWWDSLFVPDVTSEMQFEDVFSNPRGKIECAFDTARWRSFGLGAGSASLILSPDELELRRGSFVVGEATIAGRGSVTTAGATRSVSIPELSISFLNHSFTLTETAQLEVSDTGLQIESFSLREGESRLIASGRVGVDSTVRAQIELRKVPVAPWVSLFREDIHASGIFSGIIDAGGTIRRPEISLTAAVDSVLYDSLYLGQLLGTANYSDGLLICDSVVLKTPQGRHLVRGYLPMNLSPQASQIIDRKAPLSLTLESVERGFDLVPYWLPSIEDIQGELRAPFTLRGNYDSLDLIGQITLNGIKVKYLDLVDTLSIDSATVRMENNKLLFEDFTGWTPDFRRRGARSYAVVNGNITIGSLDSVYYALDVAFPREFPVRYELDDVEAVIEGDLSVNGYNRPFITGDLAVLSMQYRVEFSKAGEGSPLMGALADDESLDLDIDIEIPSNYYIHNQDIDAEFSGQVNVRRERNLYRYTGEIEVVRGKGYLFDKTFALVPGGTVTFNGEERFNPQLNLTGCTFIPGLSDSSGTIEQLQLCIQVTGTLENPEINPTEGSGFTREDIFPLLVANYYSNSGTRAASSLEQRISSLVASQVSQIGTSRLGRLLGVETFQIDPGNSTRFDVRSTYVTLGLYTLPKLYVYSRSAIEGQEVGFEYRFNRSTQLEGIRNEDELYHLNLKLHWEF